MTPEQIAEGKRLLADWAWASEAFTKLSASPTREYAEAHRALIEAAGTWDRWAKEHAYDLLSTIESLQADGQDAKRYRWLRNSDGLRTNRLPHIAQYPYCEEIDDVKYPQMIGEDWKRAPENIDAAIDAAIGDQG